MKQNAESRSRFTHGQPHDWSVQRHSCIVGKERTFWNMVFNQVDIHTERHILSSTSHCTLINSRQTVSLNVKGETLKLVIDNRDYLPDSTVGNGFFEEDTKTLITKGMFDEWYFIKLRTSANQKISSRVKSQLTKQGETFLIHMSNKGLTFRICDI